MTSRSPNPIGVESFVDEKDNGWYASAMTATPKSKIQRYLQTGDYDFTFSAWPQENINACMQQGHIDITNALISEIRQRDKAAATSVSIPDDLVLFTRKKVTPMVQGLFNCHEQEVVLNTLERSVIFLTPSNVCEVIKEVEWPGTAWDMANLYLASIGAELLSPKAPQIVGLSEGTTCYVSMEYFQEGDRFADYVIHEVAHIFHNCKRATIELPERRSCEWLLDIEFRKRETFAYTCEAYNRILEHGKTPAVRQTLLAELAKGSVPSEERVDVEEYLDILREAVAARNGWRRILNRCSRRTK